MQWSKFQTDIFDFVTHTNDDLVIKATAGSGKTTTIVEAIKYIPANQKVLFATFSKLIIKELQSRLPKSCQANTLNSLGWSIIRNANKTVLFEKEKNEIVLRSMINPELEPEKFWRLRGPILRLVSALKAYNYDGSWSWEDVLDPCGIELPEFKENDNFVETLKIVFNRSVKDTSVMDFDDQLFQVIKRNYPLPHFDSILIDESQDLNIIQIELLKRFHEQGTRIIAVGDDYQAIYGFRGADSNALNRIIEALGCGTLPLSVCYRCPDKVIKAAQGVNPTILAPSPNPRGDGIVDTIETKEFIKNVKDGDYVLCRTTAPLVQRCLELIRMGRKAVVKGRDIGDTLIDLIEKIHGSSLIEEVDGIRNRGIFPAEPTFPPFAEKLNTYRSVQLERLEKKGKEDQMILLNDKVDTILAIGEDCDHIGEVILRILNIFSDNVGSGVVLMTGHKCKGLEAKIVYILQPDLLPHPKAKSEQSQIQERNIKFVMLTRAMEELYYVTPEPSEKMGNDSDIPTNGKKKRKGK